MGEFFRRLSYLWNRRRREQELSDEMEFHREMAARSGHADFGNALHLREESRDAWGWTAWDRLRQDLRYAARMLWRSPGFTLSAVLILAIGSGVNVAVFGFFDLMVLRPLNVREPATLLRFHRRSPEAYAYSLPYPAMAFYREHAKTLSAVIALNSTRVAVEGEDKHLEAHFVTTDFFTELGATTLLGRPLLVARDEAADAEAAIVLSYGFWQRHFGGDLGVAGRKLEGERQARHHRGGRATRVRWAESRCAGAVDAARQARLLCQRQQTVHRFFGGEPRRADVRTVAAGLEPARRRDGVGTSGRGATPAVAARGLGKGDAAQPTGRLRQ